MVADEAGLKVKDSMDASSVPTGAPATQQRGIKSAINKLIFVTNLLYSCRSETSR